MLAEVYLFLCIAAQHATAHVLSSLHDNMSHAGYGNTYPNECWAAAWLIMVQSVLGMIMDAITIGIVFARISHPKQRGRTIAISDSAVISRRDGILKFMFRIADIRRTQASQILIQTHPCRPCQSLVAVVNAVLHMVCMHAKNSSNSKVWLLDYS